MAGAEQIHLQQFEVAGIAAPPGLLCLQLEQSGNSLPGADPDSGSPQADTLVLQNPFLLMRVLDAQHKIRTQQQPGLLSQRLTGLDAHWLHSLLSDTALQLVLQGRKSDQLFYQLYWQQARRCALVARALAHKLGYRDALGAEASALLLHAGMLVLEQQHGSAWGGLYQEIDQQTRLLEAEQQTLGLDHLDAGVRLLESWQLEQNCVDALRYQATDVELILDATPLVRICWLANQLTARNPGTNRSALTAATRLFALAAEEVEQLVHHAEAAFLAECSSWGLAQRKPLVLPLSEPERRYFAQEAKEELQQLQRQMLGETALAALDGLDTAGSENLKSVLARALQQAGVDPRFIVLSARQDSRTLTVSTSSKVAGLSADLALQLQPGRSALADLILANELALLSRNSGRLAVIDRQVIDLLGGSSLLCEPVQTPLGRCALLLSGSATYPQRNQLRNFIKRKLAAFLQQEQQPRDDEPPMELTQYQQRVREAVHEANNPLAIIKNYLQILNMKLGENGASKEIRLINQEIDRVAVILAELRRVETTAPAESAELDLNALVRSLHRVFLQGFNADKPIAIELDLTDDPALVMARTDALKQILTNLVKNAVEAFDQAGSIIIATRRNVVLHENLFMQLSVADNGPGMTAELLQNLYVPGTTTKGGDHTGSGLAIVKRLVDDMQGLISCQSDSKGTVISILLPQILV